MSWSYGYAYLTSYGWTGSGTGLRKGAIVKPLAIPPKKCLSGLGKDRDDAFPFWDHLFTAASKAITIKISTDDEDVDDTEDPSSQTDPESVLLQRTTTGIISNRRPILGTPASTSGSTTPNSSPGAATPACVSLLASAKREAAKRGLYSRFFRGPVLDPDDGSRIDTASHLSCELSSISTPAAQYVGNPDSVVGETKKRKKRKSEDETETKEDRIERKRLKSQRKAAKATGKEKDAQKRYWLDDAERKARKHQHKQTRFEENQASPCLKRGDDEPVKCMRKELEEGQNASRRPSIDQDTTDTFNVVFTTKRKKRKRMDTRPF